MNSPEEGIFDKLKPSASRNSRLAFAGIFWLLAGIGLTVVGFIWMVLGFHWISILLLAFSVLVGIVKSKYILDNAARIVVNRIMTCGDDRCIGGAFSWKSWLVIIGMMFLGYALRHSGIMYRYIGILYSAIGIGLLWSDRIIFSALKKTMIISA